MIVWWFFLDLAVFVVPKSHNSRSYDPECAASVGMAVDPKGSGDSSSSNEHGPLRTSKAFLMFIGPTDGPKPVAMYLHTHQRAIIKQTWGCVLQHTRKSTV